MNWMEILEHALPGQPGLRGAMNRRAVVMVLLAGDEEDPVIVFEERAAGITQGGEIGFPGGMVDPEVDRSVVQTALREASEELGVAPEQFAVLGRLDSLMTRWGLQIDVVVARCPLPVSAFVPREAEVARLFGLPLSWLLNQTPELHGVVVKSHPTRIHPTTGEEEWLLPAKTLQLPERYHHPWGDAVIPVVFYHTPQGTIWGVTGDILQDFLKRFGVGMHLMGPDDPS